MHRAKSFLVLLAACAAIVAGLYAKAFSDNWHYADRVFAPVAKYDRVIASRRWHPERVVRSTFATDLPKSCIYAVVELSSLASDTPPGRFLPTRRDKEFYVFGMKEWLPTPGPEIEWDECRVSLGDALFDQLASAMAQPGGWWAKTPGAAFLYAPEAKLAFRMGIGP